MLTRRGFLADVGMGFTGLALGSMLFRDGVARAGSLGDPHFAPKAKSVIWLFMVGGASQMDTFDPKPELNKWAGKTINESPYNGGGNTVAVELLILALTGDQSENIQGAGQSEHDKQAARQHAIHRGAISMR